MDNNYRLKVKVGEHEFDGDGPTNDVKEQFRDFKELVALALSAAAQRPHQGSTGNGGAAQGGDSAPEQAIPQTPRVDPTATDAALVKIMKVDNRVVSLTLRPQSVEDAILLILYGQKAMRQNEAITGSELIDGLKATGGLAVERVDRLMEKAATDGDVLVSGERRAKRYRLTNTGLAKARAVASNLIAMVA